MAKLEKAKRPDDPPASLQGQHHLGDIAYYHFKEVGPTFSRAIKRHARDRKDDNYTAYHLFMSDLATPPGEPTEFELLVEKLESIGIKRVSDRCMAGAIAFLLETNDHQMVRLVHEDAEHERAVKPYILQPIVSHKVDLQRHGEHLGSYYIEILPKVHTLQELLEQPQLAKSYNIYDVYKTSREFIHHLLVDARKNKQFFFDPSPQNIGVIQDRNGKPVPVIIDAGAAIDLNMVDSLKWAQFAERVYRDRWVLGIDNINNPQRAEVEGWTTKIPTQYLLPMLKYVDNLRRTDYGTPHAYEEAQAAHLERLGLRKDHARDIFNKDENAQRKADFIRQRSAYKSSHDRISGEPYDPQNSVFMKLADKGVSWSEMQYLAAHETPSCMEGEPKRFCEMIQQGATRDGIIGRNGR